MYVVCALPVLRVVAYAIEGMNDVWRCDVCVYVCVCVCVCVMHGCVYV